MHISLLPTSSPPEPGPARRLLDEQVQWLREELTHAELPEERATLQYELGVLLELAGMQAEAVREHLAAANSIATFREPVERLIALVERHRSFRNLPPLLQHRLQLARQLPTSRQPPHEGTQEQSASGVGDQVRSAASGGPQSRERPHEDARGEEHTTALLGLAWYALNHERDLESAHRVLQPLLARHASDATVQLTAEVLAARRSDPVARAQALIRRYRATRDPELRAALQLHASYASCACGDYHQARLLLREPAGEPGRDGLVWETLELSLHVGYQLREWSWCGQLLPLLLAQRWRAAPPSTAELVRGVAEALYIASAQGTEREIHSESESDELEPNGSEEVRDQLLASTLELLEEHGLADADPQPELSAARATLVLARVLCALRSQRWKRVAELVEAELERGASGMFASALIQAQAHAVLQDHAALAEPNGARVPALLVRARKAHAQSAWAHALALNSARAAGAVQYASALDTLAQEATTGEGRAQLHTCAMAALAHRRRDPERVREYLRKIAEAGLPELPLRRLERVLAQHYRDEEWTAGAADALRQALRTREDEFYVATLQVLRRHFLTDRREDQSAVSGLLKELGDSERCSSLAHLLRAFGSREVGERQHALEQLAAVGNSPVLRWLAQGGPAKVTLQSALALTTAFPRVAWLQGLHLGALVTGAQADDDADAKRELSTALEQTAGQSSPALARSLLVEAGLRRLSMRDFESSTRCFDAASELGVKEAEWLAGWTYLMAAELTDAASPLVPLLARFAAPREQRQKRNADPRDERARREASEAMAALEGLVEVKASGTRRKLAPPPEASAPFKQWAACLNAAHARTGPAATRADAMKRWAGSTLLPVAYAEWAAAALVLRDTEQEVEARRSLAQSLPDDLAEPLRASAALTTYFAEAAEPVGLLAGHGSATRLCNLELAGPGSDPELRVEALAQCSDLLAESDEALDALLSGYNLLALERHTAAASAFERYAASFPDDPSGWEGLATSLRPEGASRRLAEALLRLGDTSSDTSFAAEQFEAAADIYATLDAQPERVAALARAVDADIKRESSFAKLLQARISDGDSELLLQLVERGLGSGVPYGNDAQLHWLRAKCLREKDDYQGALVALAKVLEKEPHHFQARALRGEILVVRGDYRGAVEQLVAAVECTQASRDERLTAGLSAVDLLDNQLSATDEALRVLLLLHRSGLATLRVRERIARAAVRSGAWREAIVVLEQLMFERTTDVERAEAARLAIAIHRDRLQEPRLAGHAVEALLRLLPGDSEALDLVLSGSLDPMLTSELIASGRAALANALAANPDQPETLLRLSRIAEHIPDWRLRQMCLGTLLALGVDGPSRRAELAMLEEESSRLTSGELSPEDWDLITDAEDGGPVLSLLSKLHGDLYNLFGPTLKSLGVGKRDRVDDAEAQQLPLWGEIHAWARAFGIPSFQLYASSQRRPAISVVPTAEGAAVVMCRSVTAPLHPAHRALLLRGLCALRRGISLTSHYASQDIAAFMLAACRASGRDPTTPPHNHQEDIDRQVLRGLPRRTRKALTGWLQELNTPGSDITLGAQAIERSLDRAALIGVGDVSWVLHVAGLIERGESGPPRPLPLRVRRLLGLAMSSAFEQVRAQLGVGPR